MDTVGASKVLDAELDGAGSHAHSSLTPLLQPFCLVVENVVRKSTGIAY